jgi:hypothetical protein
MTNKDFTVRGENIIKKQREYIEKENCYILYDDAI